MKSQSRIKTYSHLSGEPRMPSEYEIVTTDLLYYLGRGFEVTTPLRAWYAKYQTASPLVANDWERFVDPRETTYAKYAELSQAREAYVDAILQSIEDTGYDGSLSPEWRATLDSVLGPLRFPVHGLQMIAAYVGQMAPSGRIAVAAAFQAADEVRRVQRIAYRMGQLRRVDPSFGAGARDAWQHGESWQPLRETIEQCLATYDWGEALVALNLCIKPVIDELFMVEFPKIAALREDILLGRMFGSLDEDCQWHREWTIGLLETAIDDDERNRAVIESWAHKWVERGLRSAAALDPFAGPGTSRAWSDSLGRLLGRIGVEAPRA